MLSLIGLSTFVLLLSFVLAVLIEDSLHVLDGLLVAFVEYLFASTSDDFLKHLLFFFEEKFKPKTLTLWDDLDLHVFVDFFVLLFDEGAEALGLVTEPEFPSKCLRNVVNLL